MADDDLNAGPHGAPGAPAVPNTDPLGGSYHILREATDWLEDNRKIELGFDRHDKYRRYVVLRLNELQVELISLYTDIFQTHWHALQRATRRVDIPAEFLNREPRYMATVYICTWIHDLYVSNRRAAYKLCPEAYAEYYILDLAPKILKYDAYLTILQATIRPTPISFTHESTLYVPKLSNAVDVNAINENYFSLGIWHLDTNLVNSTLELLHSRKLARLEPTIDVGFGRPSWLFSWHTSTGHAYAWFPTENNYDMRDVAVAYIIGVAYTPKLGPRDKDDWTNFPRNIVPAQLRPSDYARIEPITYHGATEVNEIETRIHHLTRDDLRSLTILQRPPQPTPAAPPLPPPQRRGPETRQRGSTGKTSSKASGSKRVRMTTIGETEEGSFALGSESDDQSVNTEGFPETTDEPTDRPVGNQPEPQPNAQPVDITTSVTYRTGAITQYRIVTYIYHHDVTAREDRHSRVNALRMIIRPV